MAFKILIVEDDPLILMAAAETLRDAGFSVVEVETADAGLCALEQGAEDICALFSDIETPGQMNGLALATATAERWPKIPVVLTSGRVTPARDALPQAVHFIGKPYDLTAVTKLLIHLTDA